MARWPTTRGDRPSNPTDIESLRDLASGAPVVRALNDLLERAVELRATTSISSRFAPALWCACGSTACCGDGVAPRRSAAGVDLAGQDSRRLNIAERRLPQDAPRVARQPLRTHVRVATMPTQHGESAVSG